MAAPQDAESPSFAALFAAEDRHFWFRARNCVLERVVRRLTRGWGTGYRVLEVGCGNGNVLRMLERVCAGAEVTGVELHDEGVGYARTRVRSRVLRADLFDLPFPERFNLVGLFDVLEHLPDDRAALAALRGATDPAGRIILTVPAYQSLWSHVDEVAGHYRRYTPATLRRAFTDAAWEVEYLSPFMLPLTPLMWAKRRLAAIRNRLRPAARAVDSRTLAVSELKVVPVVNPILYGLLAAEAPLLAAGCRLPVGTSLLAVARPAGAAAKGQTTRRVA
jgi:SAM-dependent methyltransferase